MHVVDNCQTISLRINLCIVLGQQLDRLQITTNNLCKSRPAGIIYNSLCHFALWTWINLWSVRSDWSHIFDDETVHAPRKKVKIRRMV